MSRHFLVTGGAGFIGSHLARALLARGDRVRVLDDLSMGRASNLPSQAELIEGDIRHAPTVARAVQGIDAVFHLAARVSIRASMDRFVDDASVNVMGTLTLLEALAQRPVERIVLASSMGVYADSLDAMPVDENHSLLPISPYGVGKLAAERYAMIIARERGMRVIALRYFNTYGPGQALTPYVGVVTIFINRLLVGEAPVVFGDGSQTRDFVSVHDVVAANLLAADYQGSESIFNVGSGVGRSVASIAQLLCERIAPGLRPRHAPAHAGEISHSVADIGRARTELGYTPQGRFEVDVDPLIAQQRAARAASA